MATTKLVIRARKINSDGKCVIFVIYTHDEKSILVSTGEKIEPEFWEPKLQKVKKGYRGSTLLNDTIQSKKEDVDNLHRIARLNKIEPTVEYIKKQLQSLNSKSEAQKDFFTIFEEFIKHNEPLKAKATIKHYRTSLKHLKKFSVKAKLIIKFEEINNKFYDKYIKYLYSLDLQDNTVGNEIKYLKTFLGWANDHNYTSNTDYKKFKKPTAKTDIVTLTQLELNKLLDFDLSNNSRLERVRDVFVFECVTGLRYSDLANLKPENIKTNHIELIAIKTGKKSDKLIIPINKYARQILAKYEDKLPEIPSNQKMNDYLKELGKLCGIDTIEQRTKFIGSKRIEEAIPKYVLLTTHTARRTFITQSLERGLRPEVIMKVTGHKDIKTMMKYVRITNNVVSTEMLKAWNN